MKATLIVINKMQADGVIGHYAIGGAVGATFYLEPVATLDIDIFISFQTTGSLISLSPIYDYLTALGFQTEKEYIKIGGWPVQFLPAGNALLEEALEQALFSLRGSIEQHGPWLRTIPFPMSWQMNGS